MKTEKATFAAGCFWGVESAFRHLNGVISTRVGYTGGRTENPTYKKVCTGTTAHAEAVEVTFDPSKVTFPQLLDAFWSCHDPTTIDRQGPDVGSQYRSAIFFHTPHQEEQARASLKEVDDSLVFRRKIVTEIVPAPAFYDAEDYHQQYFQKQGREASCHLAIANVRTQLAVATPLAPAESPAANPAANSAANPAANSTDCSDSCGVSHWKALSDAELRHRLTPEQYSIARQAGTERTFTGKYWNDHRPGIYRCAVCEQELFDAASKFDSGTGWPSFFAPIRPSAVTQRTDRAHGMIRTEVLCSRCQSHLGHLFDDGPDPTGMRYCMNSAVLDLKPSV